MLIFTRRIGEEIRIGNDIRIRIVDIKGKQVRLGIEAPPEVIVHREEVYLRINDPNNSGKTGNTAENFAADNGSAGKPAEGTVLTLPRNDVP